MKKLAILFLIICIQNSLFSQTTENAYPFSVEITGKGKPIILIPGLSCSGTVWKQTTDALQSKYECHTLTLAGFDHQKPIDLKNGFIPTIQKAIIAYINNELSEKPIIIGHSLGGFITMSIACSQSEILSQIIIVDAYPFTPAAFNPNATKENTLPQAKQMKETILGTPDSLFYEQEVMKLKTMITDDENIQTASAWIMKSDRATVSQIIFELMTTDLRDEVENIKIPILVLGSWYGLKDYGVTKDFVNNNYKTQFSEANNCEIIIADTAKHFIMWDEPKWFWEKIKSFISYE